MRGVRACVLLFLIGWLPAVVSAQDKFFTSNGVRIRYVDQGAGEPVVLVHGYTNDIENNWIATGVLPNLVKDHRVIAFDLRGHGKSDKPHDPKAYAELGQDVVRLLDHLNIVRAHIVGYSLGGIITAKLLTTNPDRFITATLIAAAGRRSWTAKDERDAEATAADLEGGVPYRSLILVTAPTDQPPPTEEAIRESSQRLVGKNDPLAHAALTRARREQVVTDSQMAAVQVPSLAIVGTADPALAGIKGLKAAWPALQVVTVEGATHWGDRGILTRPEFGASLRQFIAAHRDTALAQASNSEVGTWKLNLAKSTFNQGPAPKILTIKIEAAGTGKKTIVDTVESDGRVRHFEATANYDGKDNPRITTDGGLLPNGDVVALRRVDANTTTTIQKKDGKVIITRTSVVSDDGKTMTTTTIGMNALGQETVDDVGVFDKQ